MTKNARRRFTPQEKVSILKQHMLKGRPMSDGCDAYGLHSNIFYSWLKAWFENGAAAFEKTDTCRALAKHHRCAELEAKLDQDKGVKKRSASGGLMCFVLVSLYRNQRHEFGLTAFGVQF